MSSKPQINNDLVFQMCLSHTQVFTAFFKVGIGDIFELFCTYSSYFIHILTFLDEYVLHRNIFIETSPFYQVHFFFKFLFK